PHGKLAVLIAATGLLSSAGSVGLGRASVLTLYSAAGYPHCTPMEVFGNAPNRQPLPNSARPSLLGTGSAFRNLWCARRDSNPHDVTHCHLKAARLPIPPRALREIDLPRSGPDNSTARM